MELAEAAGRSLRRGRTVDLHYESISEDATFKSVMTSTGCLILLRLLVVLPLSMAGPPLGLKWTLFIPYLIPPILVIFVFMQVLRPAMRKRATSSAGRSRRCKDEQAEEGPRIDPFRMRSTHGRAGSSRVEHTMAGSRRLLGSALGTSPGASRKLSRLLRNVGASSSNRFDSTVYLTS